MRSQFRTRWSTYRFAISFEIGSARGLSSSDGTVFVGASWLRPSCRSRLWALDGGSLGAGCDDSRRGGSFPRSLLASEGVRGAGAPGVPLRVRVRTERFPDGHRICTWALVCYTCGASGRAGEAAWTCVFGRVLAGSWPPVRSAALPFDPWRVRSWRVLVHLSGVAAPRRTSIGLGAPFEWSLDAPPGDGV